MASTPTGPGRPGLLRSMNDRAALALLIANGPMTRVQLGEATGLSGPTASQLVARLAQAGLVDEAGRVTRSRGPNAVLYQARTQSARGVAADVQAGRVVARVVDANGQPHPVVEVPLKAKGRSAEADLDAAITAACAAAAQDRGDIVAVCVGVPGAVSPDSDVLRFVGTLPNWPRHAVRAHLEERLGLDVIIENDANLAAVAEAQELPDGDDFAFLWQGEGLGVAFMADGLVRRGAAGGAGEIGSLPAPRASVDARAADLQDLAGSLAVVGLVRARHPSTRTYAAALKALRGSDLRPKLLADLAPRTAQVLAPVLAVLDPARVVLGGPTGAAAGAEGARLVQACLRRTTRWRTPVVATVVPDQPVLRGAALRLAEHLTQRILGQLNTN